MKPIFLFLIASFFVTSVSHAEIGNACIKNDGRLMSPDKSWGVCPTVVDNRFMFSLNGKEGELYDWTGFPDFSLDNKMFAYKARNGNEWFVVSGYKNGKQTRGKSYSEIESVIWDLNNPAIKFAVFGPKGNLVYSARQDNDWFIVSDHESPAYEWSRPIIFSPDGSKFGYKAKLGGKWFVVVNDKPGKSYDWVGIPIFSPDSKNFAYKARNGNEWFVVVGDKEGRSYENVSFPSWSSDSKDFVYQAKYNNLWHVVLNSIEGKGYERIASLSDNNDYRDFGMITFAKDSKSVEYVAFIGGVWRIITGEKEGGIYNVPKNTEITNLSVTTISGATPIEEFRNADGQLRSLASRLETRIDKFAEKRGFEDQSLWDNLAAARLDIHNSEDKVLDAGKDNMRENLKSAKKYAISAKKKLLSIINEIK